jgi:hypothetical protein
VSIAKRGLPAGPEARVDEPLNDFDDLFGQRFFRVFATPVKALAQTEVEIIIVGHRIASYHLGSHALNELA